MTGTDQAAATNVRDILKELRELGSERNRTGMARYGINVARAYGIPVAELRRISRRVGKDHELALALWDSANHEARILACLIDDATVVTEEQMEAWAGDFDSWDLCDQATNSLFRKTPHAWTKAIEWSGREEEWVRRAAFSLMASLACHDNKATDADFLRVLPLIERAAFDERNFVKKAVNWALRGLGKRNAALNAAAIKSAERIQSRASDQARGKRTTAPGVRSARWIARNALRELTSEDVRKRVASRSPANPASDTTRRREVRRALALEDKALLEECKTTFFVAGGPGGQHRNKTSSAVRLAHPATGVTVTASERRSQARNRKVALERLRKALENLTKTAAPRKPTRPTLSSKRRRVAEKKRQGERKASRRRPTED